MSVDDSMSLVVTTLAVTVVRVAGELDSISAVPFLDACAALGGDVVVDLVGLDFLDGGGYVALLAAREVITGRGGRLRVCNAIGAPARLLRLLSGTRFGDPRLEVLLGVDADDPRELFAVDVGADAVPAHGG
jgi:anti-anti-sigma factor